MENYIKKQLEEGYNAKLDALFAEWKASYQPEDDAENKFCPDGLLIKYKDEESGYDINKKWDESERKIMFIVKDCPDEWGYDVRRLLVGSPDNEAFLKNAERTRNVKDRFFKNIANILYGLSVMTQENKGVADAFNNIDNNKRLEAFADIPFAYVEAKKLAGKKTCSDSVLRKTLDRDGHFLAREIEILQPNIIVCFEKNGRIFDSIIKNYLNGKVPDDNHRWEYDYVAEGEYHGFDCKLYYYEDEGLLLFNSYHPTAIGIPDWKVYEKVLNPFRQYFERYRTFDYLLEHKNDLVAP